MRTFKNVITLTIVTFLMTFSVASKAAGQDYGGQEDPNKKIIKSGLLGAGVGAISSSASGGDAGKGALIGAGTNVIGGALLDSLTGSSQPAQQQQPVYVQQAPVYAQQQTYSQNSYPVQTQGTYQRVDQQPVYVQQQPVYYSQPQQEDPNKKIIKSGLLGAGVGAISASASGGSAGKGALIGAGTNVIGGALLDSLMGSGSQPQQQPVYVQQQPMYQQQPVYQQQPYQQSNYSTSSNSSSQLHKKIIRKYDKDGNVVSEEEVWE